MGMCVLMTADAEIMIKVTEREAKSVSFEWLLYWLISAVFEYTVAAVENRFDVSELG